MGRILRFVSYIVIQFAFAVSLMPTIAHAATGTLNEGLLVEADLKQGAQAIAGRVLIEAGRTEWTTIAESNVSKKTKRDASDVPLKLEARASLLEPDVVEIETRITGHGEQNGKLIVRLGERAEMSTSQMESTDATSKDAAPTTSVGLKVLRIRYTL